MTFIAFLGSDRRNKLEPSTTPGPGQYKPILLDNSRSATLKSRTRIFGSTAGEDSPGPNSYVLPGRTLLKRSHNRRAGAVGENAAALISGMKSNDCKNKSTGVSDLIRNIYCEMCIRYDGI